MVKGLESFKEWFRGYEQNYVIIGGTACDLLMSEVGAEFRVTKDIDMVLITESLTADFGSRFWEYIKTAGYEHRSKSSGKPEYYRFTSPRSLKHPIMIELFSRRIEGIALPPDAVLTPLPLEDDISSLSAILLDNEYYNFLKSGVKHINEIPVLGAAHLIPFKARACLDLTRRKDRGEPIDSRNIKKHRNDVLRLMGLLSPADRIVLPKTIGEDMQLFLPKIKNQSTQYERLVEIYVES
jgi:hypothetical protein